MSKSGKGVRFLAAGSLAALVLIAAGVAAGLVLAPQQSPVSLEEGPAVTTAPVTYQTFDDARQLAFALVTGESDVVKLNNGGTVTSLTCEAGTPLASGDTPLTLDSHPVAALYTEYPLWRDLRQGDKGSDVAAVQAELGRLGYAPGSSGVMDKATIAALKAFFGDRGYSKPDGSLSRSSILWLSSPSPVIAACPLKPGDTVGAGDTFVTTGGGLVALSPALAADGLAPGARVVSFGESQAAVDEDGRVTDAAFLAVVAASPDYALATTQVAEGAAPRMTFTSKLATALDTAVVPAGALYGVAGTAGCISTGGKGLPVTIVSSRLGSTYVVIDGGTAPTTVDLNDALDRTAGTGTCS